MKWHVLCNWGAHNVLGGHKRKRSLSHYNPPSKYSPPHQNIAPHENIAPPPPRWGAIMGKTQKFTSKCEKTVHCKLDLFRLCPPPPRLVGAYYLHPHPRSTCQNLHVDLPCNDTCSVTGWSIMHWGGGGKNGKDPANFTQSWQQEGLEQQSKKQSE